MYELPREIPDINLLLELEPEELASKILFLLKRRQDDPNASSGNRGMFMLSILQNELWQQHLPNTNSGSQYPREKESQVTLALSEAWAWLEAQGLLVPASDTNGRNGWRVLSRRVQKIQNAAQFASFKVARLLPKELLHPKIADLVWGAFVRGEFDVAAFRAMKGVEVAVRAAAGLGVDLIGVKLMREAFAPGKGVLTDLTAEGGEQVARMELFAGAIGSYKNPQSHRDVNLNDPYEALGIIFLANNLLHIVDARSKANGNFV